MKKLTTEGELSGLLNLAFTALRQLIKDKGFIYRDDIQTVQREYILIANTVEAGIDDEENWLHKGSSPGYLEYSIDDAAIYETFAG